MRTGLVVLGTWLISSVAVAQTCPSEPSLGRIDWASEMSGSRAPDEAGALLRVRELEQALTRPTAERGEQLRQLGEAQREVYRVTGDEQMLTQSIRSLATLMRDFPEHPHMDRSLFLLAWGLGEMDQHDRARQVYHRLIRNYPQSPYVPTAYLRFGDFYFAEGDARAAERFYDRAAQMQAGAASAYAGYMRAWALHRAGEPAAEALAGVIVVQRSPLLSAISRAIDRDRCRLRP